MIYAAIVAGGSGSRMGADNPKQFLELDGKPIIIRTIERFVKCGKINKIYVGVHADWLDFAQGLIDEFSTEADVEIVKGGKDRTETIYNILEKIESENEISADDIVVTHDGVRPFVSVKEIEDSILMLKSFDGVTLCLPSTDTLLCSPDGIKIASVPDRSQLFRAITPQTFKLKALLSAYRSLDEKQKSSLTDTASIFTSAGLEVGLVQGSERNIKITMPFDMKTAELLLKEK